MKIKYFLIPLVLTIFLLVGLSEASTTTPILDVILNSQTPYPVPPGENVIIEAALQNSGYGNAENKVLEIVPKAPFTLLPGQDLTKTFSNIPAAGFVTNSYELFVADDTPSNNYELDFHLYSTGTKTNYVIETILIRVQGQPKLVLTNLTVDKEVEPGGIATLKAKIKNIGTGKAKQLQVDFNSTTLLIPVLAKGSVYIGDLKQSEEKEIDIEIAVDKSAEHKTYTTYLTATYKDESNTEATKTFDIGIPVTGSVLLNVIKIEPDFARNVLKIEVANKGTTSAESVEAKLIVNGKALDIDYVSQIKATKKTTFSFPLVSKGTGKLEIKYRIPGLEERITEKDVVLEYTNPNAGSAAGNFVTVVIILVVIYLLYRKFIQKKTVRSLVFREK